ncbi:MAG: leucyl aminopeptidase [Buchnera aphidicola (Pentalonia nigronervosa)]|jgi:leucyl aminopeptidase|uniref:Probable cytosol aminopeptidase n=1 Tax=Buchnera aphidicola (Pentalonia nigronervosa) TaxID=1309793 RepID=A0A7H1AZY6_9GAMM|nr:MAG: leucyl aminopeptidase [Buchnera aphidicola (Pentalonia nigronervosa)]
MKFLAQKYSLSTEKVDCIIIGIFDSNELTDSGNYLDKCSNGYITSLIKLGDITGKIGQTLLLYNIPHVCATRILLVGCGKKNTINKSCIRKILISSFNFLKLMPIKKIICTLSELNIKKNNTYWIVRCMILAIQESLYKIRKINEQEQQNFDVYSIVFHIFNENNLPLANDAIKHGLSIGLGITYAKNISNLPPNICHPLYLSYQTREFEKKYKKNVTVETIDVKEMKKLGMNAYLSVGQGSKNKPIMSVIKYSGNNVIDNQVIVLVGKGLTFDSGGISIKSSDDMDNMKYDMCGAAAVYGVLTMVAELQLPLNIIGILAGCENMLGSGSFRPGDILTTMSGKTVEVLNTDAEGRLVLCDVLTYIERFSPNTVIDIATLTGACVTALGESISGLFSNNEELAEELIIASKESNDKIWRLPLFSEYQKELKSNFSDFSNIGKGKAGAIHAACFLSYFTKKYHWAHLDIAGTAWTSGVSKGATGCPVELLCQFLLNRLNYTCY